MPDNSKKHHQRQTNFRVELEALINRHSIENGSDTPDFILADFLLACLRAFDSAARRRTKWYAPNKEKSPT